MRSTKLLLLATAALAGTFAAPALAQVVLPAPGPNDGDASLHGTGANAIQNVLVRELNAIGIAQKLGNGQPGQSGAAATKGSLKAVSPAIYTPTAPTPANPAVDFTVPAGATISPNAIQPNFSGKFIGIASNFGVIAWSQYKDVFDGSPAGGVSKAFNPFNLVTTGNTPTARWNHVQFAFSNTPITPSDLTDYQNGGTSAVTGTFPGAAASAGPAVQIPLFVLPIAIGYSPVYGKTAGGTNLVFNVVPTATINGLTSASLALSRKVYCDIFNGDITNWNDSRIQALNGKNVVLQGKKKVNIGVPLFDPTNDNVTRWVNDGVPIRLVGRLDNGGTTDIFTRHLAAVCSLSGNTETPNKYVKSGETLPYDGASGIDYRSVRSDTNIFPGVTSDKLAGTTNTISGDYWDDGAKTIKYIGAGPHATPNGNNGSGLYLVAVGNTAIANAIVAAPDYALNGVTLNGKIGFIGAEYVPTSPNAPAGIAYAQLQVGTTAKYAPPSATASILAFGTGANQILPPESDATGAYKPGTDNRLVRNAGGATVKATRDNPIAWTDVLVEGSSGNTLSAPVQGYPIVGTSQFLGYTCYTPTNRQAIVELLGLNEGVITKNSVNAPVSKFLFGGIKPASLGILAQSNLGPLPAAWITAVTNTFLKKTGDAGVAGLWIQDALAPTPAKGTPTIVKNGVTIPNPKYVPQGTTNANPVCASLPGA